MRTQATQATITIPLGHGCARDAAAAAAEKASLGDTIDVVDDNGYHWGRFVVAPIRSYDGEQHKHVVRYPLASSN